MKEKIGPRDTSSSPVATKPIADENRHRIHAFGPEHESSGRRDSRDETQSRKSGAGSFFEQSNASGPKSDAMPRGAVPHVTQQMVEGSPAGSTQIEATPIEEGKPEHAVTTGAHALIVDDDVVDPGPGRMSRSQFLSELYAAVCATAEETLKGSRWSAQGCPWVDHWFGYYETKGSAHVEAAIRKYAPGAAGARDARDYIPAVADRVHSAISVWRVTGRVTGIPEEARAGMPTDTTKGSEEHILPMEREGGIRNDSDPSTVRRGLGKGLPLDGGVASRMSSAFGTGFGDVRIHTGTNAARLADRMNARAFAIGRDVAFGQGEYRPGTAGGDGLIAHELAHVVQQRGTEQPGADGGDRGMLERDAEHATANVMTRLYGGRPGTAAMPAMQGGLALQRCSRNEAPMDADYAATFDPAQKKQPTPTEALERLKKLGPAYETLRKECDEKFNLAKGIYTGPLYTKWAEEFSTRLKSQYGIEDLAEFTTLEELAQQAIRDAAYAKAMALLDQSMTVVQYEIDRYSSDQGLFQIYAALDPYRHPQIPKEDAPEKKQKKGDVLSPEQLAPAMQQDVLKSPIRQIDPTYLARQMTLGALMREFPVLGDPKLDRTALLKSGDLQGLRKALLERANDVKENILKSRGDLADKPDALWDLDRVLQPTMQELGDVPLLTSLVEHKRQQIQNRELFKGIALTAAGLLIVILTDGAAAPLVWAGRVAGATMSVVSAYEHYQDFKVEQHLRATAFDQASALSSHDPSLTWLALDIIFAISDVSGVVGGAKRLLANRLFTKLSEPAEKLMRGEMKAAEFADEVRKATPQAEAEITKELQQIGQDASGLKVDTKKLTDITDEAARVEKAQPKTTTALQKFEYWPPHDGFLGGFRKKEVLQPGILIDRYGAESGYYLSPKGTPFEMRALPAEYLQKPYYAYRVIKPFEVDAGIIAPWFSQPGMGIQYMLNNTDVESLVRNGFLERIVGPK